MESFSEEVTVKQNGQAMLISGGNALWVEGTASAKAPESARRVLRRMRVGERRVNEGEKQRGEAEERGTDRKWRPDVEVLVG